LTLRFILSPRAARDLVGIWRYLKKESGETVANRVESVIRRKFRFLARFPEGGHWRRDLTSANVRFFAVYSYLIVYRPDAKPLQIVTVLHGNRNVAKLLTKQA